LGKTDVPSAVNPKINTKVTVICMMSSIKEQVPGNVTGRSADEG
jgi:hypothetical protein